MCAAAPPRAGAPCGVGDQATPANLSLPLRANASLSPCCPALSTLTHRYDTVASSGQDVEVFDGQNSTIGGLHGNAGKDPDVRPPPAAPHPPRVAVDHPGHDHHATREMREDTPEVVRADGGGRVH